MKTEKPIIKKDWIDDSAKMKKGMKLIEDYEIKIDMISRKSKLKHILAVYMPIPV